MLSLFRPLVALRKESVDRNTSIDNLTQGVFKSLSARRAWIEMIQKLAHLCLAPSLSARRAWIEIITLSKDSMISVGRSPQGERG